jgi:general nucleoside transport system permease protein
MKRDDQRRKNWIVFSGLLAAILLALFLGLKRSEFFLLVLLAFNAAVPIALAATGEIINERAGLVNVGIEGIIALAALVAVYAAEAFGNGWLGLAGGMAFGAFIGAAFGVAATYGRGIQIIAGFGFNILALGIVAFLLFTLWNTPGFHLLSPESLRLPKIALPSGSLSWMVPAAILIAVLAHVVLHQTKLGSHIRAAGYNPFVTDTAGIDVYKLRILACMAGGALAGIAGAYLSLDYLGTVTKNVSQGRGFIAIACIVFSGLNIFLAIGVAFLFGLVEAMSLWFQNAPWAKDFVQNGGGFFFLSLPYLAVVAALVLFPKGETLSKAVGETYRRSE